MHHLSRRSFLRFSAATAGLFAVSPRKLFCAEESAAEESTGKRLIFREANPRNAEPSPASLIESWITPVRYFYVRSHAPNPTIDLDAYRLKVEGLVERPLSISLAELIERFRKQSAVATLTCAGNRRNEMSAIKEIAGVQWGPGAVGNARWEGVKLSDVLKAAGLKGDASHVWFEGLDAVPHKQGGTFPFGGSIPLKKALADGDGMPGTLLAHRMNDASLAADHGAPLRTVVPGFIGARSVKWLGKIVVSDRPSPNHFVQDVYKLVESGDAAEAAAKQPIYEFAVNSAICRTMRKSGQSQVKLAGYALPSGGGANVVSKVELSADGGKTWSEASLASPSRPWCWALWNATLEVTDQTTSVMVRATDSDKQIQPERVDWNFKGYMFNAWHKAPVPAE